MPYCRTNSCRYMTISDMKLKKALSALLSVAVLFPAITVAQGQSAATAARQALPTGPMTAATKSAAAIRASRSAQMNAARGAAAAGTTGAARSTSVVGYLWAANNSAIPDATVQLRNTVTGQVEFFTQSNALGGFTFNNVTGGSYVIEYATGNAGSVLALGHPFTVAPGETVATFVRMSNALPALIPDLTGNVVASAIQSAASAGVTAVVTPIAPVVDAAPPPSSAVR